MIREKVAINYLKKGGVIAHQTDTVIGLACLPTNKKAIKKILNLKRRSYKKALILLGSDIRQFKKYLSPKLQEEILNKIQIKTAKTITWVVPVNKKVTTLIRGDFSTIAIRITNNKSVKLLCEKTNSPLVSTSANINRQKTAKNSLKLRVSFKDRLDFILLNKNNNNKTSEIRDVITDKIYRK